jgi:translation initiation factor 1
MSRMQKNNLSAQGGLVYSTDTGRMCPNCGKAIAACICKQAKVVPKSDGIVRISRETKGRGGKSVNVISGLGLAPAELETLCTQLKKRCGTGGTAKEGTIEIQGEHRDTLVAELSKRGYTVKKAGG